MDHPISIVDLVIVYLMNFSLICFMFGEEYLIFLMHCENLTNYIKWYCILIYNNIINNLYLDR